MAALGKHPKGAPGTKGDHRSSAKLHTGKHGGTRPGSGKTTTPVSHPTEARTMGRAPAGWLK